MATETKNQHTAGPWVRAGLSIYALHHNGDYRKGEPVMVNRFYTHVDTCENQGGTPEEAEANARLIAAAPDLLAALYLVAGRLERMEPYLEFQTVQRALNQSALSAARAAIAKATSA